MQKKKCKKRYLPIGILYKILLYSLLLYFLFKYKPVIIILIFEILDFVKIVIKQSIPFLPIDLVFIFGIIASYFYSPIIGLIIFFLGLMNRILMACIEFRHIIKGVRHLPLFFLVKLLSSLNMSFFYAAFSMLILNYILKFLLNMIKGFAIEAEKTPYNITNFTISTIIFYLVSLIFEYFPFLA